MYKLIMPSEMHTEERVDMAVMLKGICKKYPEASASQLADIIYASIDTHKYQVAAFPAKRSVRIYDGKPLERFSKTIAIVKYYEMMKEVSHV